MRRLGDRYDAVLQRHRAILRGAWARHGGREVSVEGDGCFVAFADTSAAVAACGEAQHLLGEEPWPEDGPVRVRMGVHCGLASPKDDDYVALAVHQAARVVAAAHGGQVIVSEHASEHALATRAPSHSWRSGGSACATSTRPCACTPSPARGSRPRFPLCGPCLPMGTTSSGRRPRSSGGSGHGRPVRPPRAGEARHPRRSGWRGQDPARDRDRCRRRTRVDRRGLAGRARRPRRGLARDRRHRLRRRGADRRALRWPRRSDRASPHEERAPHPRQLRARRRRLCSGRAGGARACPCVALLATSREPIGVPGELRWRIDPLDVPSATTRRRLRRSISSSSGPEPFARTS